MKKYDAIYQFPESKAVSYIVSPPPMTEEEKEKILQGYDQAFWKIWDSLTIEQQLKINEESDRQAG